MLAFERRITAVLREDRDLQSGTVIAANGRMKGDRSNGRGTSRITLKWRDAGEDLETPRRLDTYDPARTRDGNERVA